MASILTTEFNRLQIDEIREESIQDNDRELEDQLPDMLSDRNALCGACILKSIRSMASYLCYKCKVYVCRTCSGNHDVGHKLVQVLSETRVRRESARCLVGLMRRENNCEGKVERNDVSVCCQINVKHRLDSECCDITGMCGLESKKWVVLDSQNSCIKIFNSLTYTLQRYIRFGSKIWDVCEVPMLISTDSTSARSNDIEESKQNLLAVTTPYIKQIWLVDASKTPAVKTNTIKMEYNCLRIAFNCAKLFVLCREDAGSPGFYSVHILSIDGQSIDIIHTDLHDYVPDFAVSNDRIYLTDEYNDRLVCLDVKNGQKVSDVIIKGSEPVGVSVDTRDNIYVCSPRHDKVYRLDSLLKGYEALNVKNRLIKKPWKLCYYKDKLYVSHNWSSDLGNTVTVVQL